MSLKPPFSAIDCKSMTEAATGTSRRRSSRLRAVTITSPTSVSAAADADAWASAVVAGANTIKAMDAGARSRAPRLSRRLLETIVASPIWPRPRNRKADAGTELFGT